LRHGLGRRALRRCATWSSHRWTSAAA
jgi:hypothetical protein